MPDGPGKYDDLVTYVRARTNAVSVALIVIEGNEGTGFAVQSLDPLAKRILPALLRQVADSIEASNRAEQS